MKIYFALIALTFCTIIQAQSKNKKWDARLAMNGYTNSYFKEGGNLKVFDFFGPDIIEKSFSAEILYQPGNRRIKTGIAITYTNVKRYDYPFLDFSGSSDHTRHLTGKRNAAAFMPVFNYSYLIKNHVQLYSEACFGATIVNNNFYDDRAKQQFINPAYQCTLIGCRFGNRIAGFTELGYGYKGILQIGISGTF